MKSLLVVVAASLSGSLLLALTPPETKIEITKVHICCGACEKAVGKVLEEAGVKGTCSKGTKSISITAADDAAAQKAVDALAAAGFHGEVDSKACSFKNDSGAKEGKVTSATVKGFHNCCPACCKAIKAVLGKLEGFESDDTKPKETSCTVKGNFDPAKLIKALNEAGFHAKVEASK
jgi:copper chaperone CopZ